MNYINYYLVNPLIPISKIHHNHQIDTFQYRQARYQQRYLLYLPFVLYLYLKLSLSKYEVVDANGTVHKLSQKDCALLKLLYQRKAQVVSRDDIIDHVWGQNSFPSYRTVDNYIVNLRKWCDTDQEEHLKIETIRGIGYKLITK